MNLESFSQEPSDADTPSRETFLHKINFWLGNRLRAIGFFIRHLTLHERLVFFALATVVVCSGLISVGYGWMAISEVGPAYGGSYTEAVVGHPQSMNPVLSLGNTADRDLVTLLYTPLFTNDKDGNLVPALASGYEVSSDQKTYTIHLNPDYQWQDGQPITADDVVFTVQLIQNPDVKSPLEPTWRNVAVEKIDDHTVAFHLPNPYAQFSNNLVFYPLPEHIWASVPTQGFLISATKIKPVGSGPFILNSINQGASDQIISATLSANHRAPMGRPYLDQITLNFFDSDQAAANSVKYGLANGMISFASTDFPTLPKMNVYKINVPEYVALFFNQNNNPALKDVAVRQAIELGINKQALLDNYFQGDGTLLSSPFMPFMIPTIATPTSSASAQQHTYNPTQAKALLEKSGWKLVNGIYQKKLSGSKSTTPLVINLTTTDWETLNSIANDIAQQLKQIGIQVNVSSVPASSFQQNILPQHSYEALLMGEILSVNPDPFLFWHSSIQKSGLNLSLWTNTTADKLLENARQEYNDSARAALYTQVTQQMDKDQPAVFLFSPQMIYLVSQTIHNVNITTLNSTSDRFDNVRQWYMVTGRHLKLPHWWKK